MPSSRRTTRRKIGKSRKLCSAAITKDVNPKALRATTAIKRRGETVGGICVVQNGGSEEGKAQSAGQCL